MKERYLIWENPRHAIYTLMFILMGIGSINVFSASYISAMDMTGNGFYYLWRYLIFSVLGLIGIRIVEGIGYKKLLSLKSVWILYIAVLLMLVAVDVIGITNKGAQRWLNLGFITFQPSELAKLSIIMLVSRILGHLLHKGRKVSLLSGDGLQGVMATLFFALLVYKQPDLGTAAIIVGLMMGVYIVAGISMAQVWGILAVGGVGAVVATMFSPYRMQRVKVWFDPWLDESGTGYQMAQSLMAIGSGGVTGANWGHGAGKFFYLPEAHTDFAFAIFCQENGFLGALLLLVLFILLAGAFFRITIRAKDRRGFLLSAGITMLIIGQAAANMAMVCGLLPVIGVPLIFISYGGTSLVISMAAIGLILSVYKEEVKREELEAVPPEVRREDLRVVSSVRGWRK